ncbi:OPT oligopeptide transporter protein-domain-containing protein [Gamsiella multidivaricata]|uniref:OPT oligopeptide transporter protein-domain-containing protein n=1 Tax=Gamsiella multidivaricata TaxID=101098 RepID=UPI0022209B26|nr:OPT oligopeptide transporter protein-domain-containing protein [Gamsiella multidivaricata]KAI7830636.1 OPT oligopeptide transporter protein-domain-containing protein [Gamsiella multidivaricata]
MTTTAASAPVQDQKLGDLNATQIHEDYPYQDLPHFTWRAVTVGILIGTLLCFTNMYFGLQTGWISMMSLQSSLLGFALFKAAKRYLKVPFGPAENIVLQSVAVATGTMPLAAGFVGIIPALQMMTLADNPATDTSAGGGLFLSAGHMILWSLAIAFFGVFIAVPLRRQVVIKEKLPFPSGTATAQMIGVLHNTPLVVRGPVTRVALNDTETSGNLESAGIRRRRAVVEKVDRDGDVEEAFGDVKHGRVASSVSTPLDEIPPQQGLGQVAPVDYISREDEIEIKGENGEHFTLSKDFLQEDNWRLNMIALGLAFGASAIYTILSYFFPVVAAIPIFDWLSGMTVSVAGTWQWYLTPSLSYVGQGVIMGFPTTASMLLGCIVGWAILSPVVTTKKWVTGPVGSSTTGARGWILWISLGVMIAEAVISLLGVIVLSLIAHYRRRTRERRRAERKAALEASAAQTGAEVDAFSELEEDVEDEDAPIDQLVPLKVWVCGLILSSALCLLLIWVVFKDQHMPVYATLLAVVLGCILSVLGVRALGSTDLNPVSGIGKVSQFVFAGVVPGGIVANLIAGGIAEAGAQQAGDLMQDLKTGHLLGASPRAQFYGQLIGSIASVFISTGVFKLYSSAYELPGPQFAVPTAKVWLDLARLVNGHSLPYNTSPFIWGFAAFFAVLTLISVIFSDVAFLRSRSRNGSVRGRPRWVGWIPSGIAFAIGMYNLPNFTLARFAGGVVSLWWDWHCRKYASHPTARFAKLGRVFLIIVASGFVLGEGTFSILNLILKTAGVHSTSCVGCYQGACSCN